MNGYIGVNNVARKIKTMYVGVNGVARKVNKAYVGVNGVARQWLSGIDTSDPNTRYSSKSLGTWNSSSQLDTFFSTYNADNNFTGLALGNYVTILDGTYNKQWVIAKFTDGGILMIPKSGLAQMQISETATLYNGYLGSYMHSELNGTVYNNLNKVLGTHITGRRCLLSSGNLMWDTTAQANICKASTITTCYLVLPTIVEITGTGAGQYRSSYDDAWANTKLPLGNFESLTSGKSQNFWYRNIYGDPGTGYCSSYFYNYFGGATGFTYVYQTNWVYPLMLLK